MALVLTVALLMPLVACESNTATPTPTSTPTTSSKTLSDIYGGGKNLGDVKADMVTTSTQSPQAQTSTVYYKNIWVANELKFRIDGANTTYLVDYGAQTAYLWNQAQNTACKIDISQAPTNPLANGDQIHPTYLGTDTVNGNLCDVWQWTRVTAAGTWTIKLWLWKDKLFPVKIEATTSTGTTTVEYQNIVFGTLSDSLFVLPAGVQVMQFPSCTP
jgi:outer membrane lipoprotein-sorting protein